MKKILIVNTSQLGLLTDSLKWCEYLNEKYDIEVLCFDFGEPKINIPNVKVCYVPHPDNYKLRGFIFLLYAIWKCIRFRGFIFVVYFPFCIFLKKILFWKRMHLDIRTLSVNDNEKIRTESDNLLRNAIGVFDGVSFISEGIEKRLGTTKKGSILPLGADTISVTNKDFSQLHLLYVGTLDNRDVIKTVYGLKLFVDSVHNPLLTYDIIGDGAEREMIESFVYANRMENICKIHGRIPHDRLKPFFDKCNIGVSFIPIKEYYQDQPPTKTFEYGLSGLITIATKTFSNCQVITNSNGVLIDDSPESFCFALKHIIDNYSQYDSDAIRESMKRYEWKTIINNYLVPILEVQ